MTGLIVNCYIVKPSSIIIGLLIKASAVTSLCYRIVRACVFCLFYRYLPLIGARGKNLQKELKAATIVNCGNELVHDFIDTFSIISQYGRLCFDSITWEPILRKRPHRGPIAIAPFHSSIHRRPVRA